MSDDTLDLIARARAAKASKGAEVGPAEGFARGALESATRMFGDELAGSLGAPILKRALGKLEAGRARLTPEAAAEAERLGIEVPGARDMSGAEAYRQVRDADRGRYDAAHQQQQWPTLAGNVVGAVFAPKLLPTVNLGPGLGGRVLSGMANAAPEGALFGLGASKADLTRPSLENYKQAFDDTRTGAEVATAVGGTLPLVGAGAKGLVNSLVRGVVKPTEAAQLLRARGVPLTTGQMNPEGALAGLEEAGQSVGGVGKVIEGQRAAAREGWQKAVLPGEGAIQERLATQRGNFGPLYEAVGQSPAQPVIRQGDKLVSLARAFESAAEDPGVYATQAEVDAAKRFLGNQASLFSRQMETEAAQTGPLTAGTLLKVRSNIREAIREAGKRQDFTAAKLLRNAEDSVTSSLEQQLPPEQLQALRGADAAYREHRVVSDAVGRAGDAPGGFTPAQLAAAVKKGTNPRAYELGGGGLLRTLAQAGRETLDATVPPTGARALAFVPGLKHATAAASALANTKPVQRALLGETAAQKWAQQLELQPPAILKQALSRPGMASIAMAEEAGVPAFSSPAAGVAQAGPDTKSLIAEARRKRAQLATRQP